MANDSTVKAGSWGARTVEKIVRLTEHALRHELPVVYLVDSAGARITDQVELFPGRRGAGRIFANEVRLSGKVPQVCCLFGPSAAGRRVHPGVLRRGVHGRGQRLDVPRLAAHGRGRDRREGVARGDGRRAHARDRQRLRRQPLRVRRGRDRRGPPLPVVPADDRGASAAPATAGVAPIAGARPIRDDRAERGAARLRHAQGDRRARRRRLVLRAEAAVGARS